MIDDCSIVEFWNWFKNNIDDIEQLSYERGKLSAKEMSDKIASLDRDLVWEIGPSKLGGWQFVISPNGVIEKLILCKHIVSLSPAIKSWEFYPAKPKKEWDRRLEVKKHNRKIMVDYRDWKYYLTAFDNNEFFDVNFVVKAELSRFGLDLYELAGLYVEAELGEELMMEIVDRINICDDQMLKGNHELTPALHLYDHLLSVSSVARRMATPCA